MIRLLWDAMWGRRAQALTVLVLTALAVGTAAASPWYVFASAEQLVARSVAAAPPEQRVMLLSGTSTGGQQLRVPAAKVVAVAEQAIGPHHEPPVTGLLLVGTILLPGVGPKGALVARDGACEHAVIEGSCPKAAGEVLLSSGAARALGIEIGGTYSMKIDNAAEIADLKVVGLYRPARPGDLYWQGVWNHDARTLDPFLVAPATFDAMPSARPSTTVDLVLTSGAYRPGLGDRISRLEAGDASWKLEGTTAAGELPVVVGRASDELSAGIVAATGRFVLLAWFALLVVVRQTVAARRTDLALVKLRGVRRWRVWTTTMGQTVWVMICGAVLGAAIGFAGVRAGIGPVEWPDNLELATVQSAELFGGVLLAALALVWLSELRSLRTPVVELLRNVPPRLRGRAVDVAELVVIGLLAVGVWQLSTVESLRSGSVTATMVPALLSIAVGLLAARFVLWLAGRAGAAAIRSGRLTLALSGLAAQRRPTLRWVVTLLVVAVAGLTTATAETVRGEEAVTGRAQQQLGAERVLDVGGVSRGRLLEIVREADPAGDRAMAVSHLPNAGFVPDLLAVDTSRLTTVGAWRSEYGPAPTPPPAGPAAIRLSDGEVTLTASFDRKVHAAGDLRFEQKPTSPDLPPMYVSVPPKERIDDDVYVQVALFTAAGSRVMVGFGPLREGRADYTAGVAGCADGCRLAWFGLRSAKAGHPNVPVTWGTRAELHGLRQGGTDVLPTAALAERSRWAASAQTKTLGPLIETSDAGLALTAPPGCDQPERSRGECVMRVYPARPAITALTTGSVARYGRNGRAQIELSGADALDVETVATASVLPRFRGSSGVVDLAELNDALGVSVADERLEVWLADADDEAIVRKLRDSGVQIRDSTTIDEVRADLNEQGPAGVRRFQLGVFGLGVLIAAVALLLLAGVERPGRAAELANLRRQGLPERIVRRVSLLAYTGPAVIAVAAGLAAAAATAWLPVPRPGVFSDGWAVLPSPAGLPGIAFLLAALATGAVVAVVLGYAARRLAGSAVGAAPRSRRAHTDGGSR
ncbi:MAG: hypothetical protein HOV79_01060 [Hamadaea sp.]|nr:hypothetical protein [Hamadaea sp.]